MGPVSDERCITAGWTGDLFGGSESWRGRKHGENGVELGASKIASNQTESRGPYV